MSNHTSASTGLVSLDRRSFLKGTALGLLGLAAFCTPRVSFAAEASEETMAALNSAQAEYEAAMAELASIGEQLEEAYYNLSECEAALAQTEAAIAELEQSIAQRQAELAEAQDILASRIAANYRAGTDDTLNLILDAANFDDFVSRVYYAGKISDADAQAIQTVKDIKADLERQEAELRELHAQQQALLEEQQLYTQQLEETQEYYASYVNSLSEEVQALMAQAQAEIAAAQQAQYEAYLAEQAAMQANNGEAGYVDPGNSGGGTGNHAGGVVGVAYECLGIPYVWGGTTTGGFDCSGLAQYCYAACGYGIARDTYSQIAQIQGLGNWRTSLDQLSPGDLVFPHSGHVGIYIGGGSMIHAPYPGEVVQVTSVYAFMGGGSPI